MDFYKYSSNEQYIYLYKKYMQYSNKKFKKHTTGLLYNIIHGNNT